MNTSYNYADFVGLNLDANSDADNIIESKVKPQKQSRLTGNTCRQLRPDAMKDINSDSAQSSNL